VIALLFGFLRTVVRRTIARPPSLPASVARPSNPLVGMQGVRTPESGEPEAGQEDPFAELSPVTPPEAKRVWDAQRCPSSRSVAKLLLKRVGPFIFARWKKREWQVEARLEHPLAVAMRKVDLAVPLLTGDPTSKAVDVIGAIVADRQSMTEDQGPRTRSL
jgi:hypothetical protein